MNKLGVLVCEAGDKIICSQLSVPYCFFFFHRLIIIYVKLFEFLKYYDDTFLEY